MFVILWNWAGGGGIIAQIFNDLFGFLRYGPLDFGHLWYLRSLMIFTAVSPLVYIIVKRRFGALVGVALWAVPCFMFPIKVRYLHISLAMFGWFVLGMASHRLEFERLTIPKSVTYCILALFLALAFAKCTLALPLAGILTIWFMYDYFPDPFRIVRKVIGEQFWTYCFHVVPCCWYVSTILFVFGKSNTITFITFLTCPFVALAINFCAYRLAMRYSPRMYSIITGGRVVRV